MDNTASQLQSHQDALLGQWRRTRELRDFSSLRALAASKGFEVVKSVGIGTETYKVFRGAAKLKQLVMQGDLTTIAKFFDA